MAKTITDIRNKMAKGLMLTTHEVAKVVGITPSTVIRYEGTSLVPDSRTMAGHRRYLPYTVDRFLDRWTPKHEN